MPLASGNASVMKRGGQEAIVVNSRLPTYSEREKEVWSFFCPRRPLLLLLLLVIPLRAINTDAIESFAILSHFSGSTCGLIVNAAFFRMSLFIGFLIEEAAVKLLKVLIVRDEDNGTR